MKLVKALLLCSACLVMPAIATAQDNGAAAWDAMLRDNPPKKITVPAELKQIPLSSTGTPNSDTWELMFGQLSVRNVTQPALIPVLPKAGTANGTAVIIAPGGAFLALSMDSEGLLVAKYLAERGITCFVLKYRVDATPVDTMGFMQTMGQRMGSAPPKMTHGQIEAPAEALAKTDGLAAMAYVRAHAGDYGLDAHKIGFMGFSAGGMTTMNVATTYTADSRPDFIGVIYGAMHDTPVPADAPPAFIALAANDGLLGYAGTPIFDAWREAGKSAELHIYAHGEHGFGMRHLGTSSDHWIDDYYNWLVAEHLTTASQ